MLAALLATGGAWAQSSSPFGSTPPPSSLPSPFPARTAPSPQSPAAPAAADVLARVEGRPITKARFDVIAGPYFTRLRAQLGVNFTDKVLETARQTVFNELVRHEILAIEAERQKIQVPEEETDALLQRDALFQNNGKFDPEKLREFKLNPQTNYLQILPRLRENVAVAKLDQKLQERLAPPAAEVRAEFEKRNAQVRLRYLALLTRDISLEPESTEPEWRAYYDAHRDEFMTKARMRLRYFRLPLPAAADSMRATAESLAVERGLRMADSLRAGTLADSSADTRDTGLFDVDAPVVPGFGREAELAAAIARADTVPSLRVLGPLRLSDAVIVANVVERLPRTRQSFLEALGMVKRRTDAERRKAATESDLRAWLDAHREAYRGTRASVTRITLRADSSRERDLPTSEVDRWYRAHGHALHGLPDSSRSWLPPLNDSLRFVIRRRLALDERNRRIAATMERLAAALRTKGDVTALARANGAVADTLTLMRGMAADSLFGTATLDSILAEAPSQRGRVQGPRAFGKYSVLWRVDSVDTAYVPAFEAVRGRVEAEFAQAKRRTDEDDGRAWFDRHRAEYVVPRKYTIDYVRVPIPPADSVRLTEAELLGQYRKTLASFRQEEQVHAQHLLLPVAAGDPKSEANAKARADSLLAAIRGGAPFSDLAKRFSGDPGSAGSDGDLGWFGRGRMVPEFERAAFALEPGQVSPVVKTSFGYHIIKVLERKAAATKPFDEVRNEVRAALASARADSSARRTAEALRRRLALAADPKPLAASYGGLKTSAPFAAKDPVSLLGFVENLSADIAKLAPGRWAPRAYRAGKAFVVIRPGRAVPEHPAEFEEVKAKAVEDAKNAKRRELLERKAGAIRAALAAGTGFDSLAAPYGGLKDSGPLTQSFGFVPGLGAEPRVVQRAFAAKPGEVSDTLQVAQGVVWFRVEEYNAGDPKSFEATKPLLTQELLRRNLDRWLAERKRSLRIEILAPEFREARLATGPAGVAGGR